LSPVGYEGRRDLGITDHNTDAVKWSLHQNASAYITAKIRYKTRTGIFFCLNLMMPEVKAWPSRYLEPTPHS